ncbi:hypothetical protein [Treponema succinifaciens]|uniref:Uncharacterized protein n=1 Tax=Treponema succinifaciens (strain ATCC 33096 / DSM 2489 / 6091) TaxID=869209 RepID=F2NYH4_TRES6|nr:hypothetical protein [Treponema succinifaciens]AEB15473.1 hypothetical protein Tresu_2611 [Treponema succinifaciens DSM 2489]
MTVVLRMNIEFVVYVAFKGVINDTDDYVILRLEDREPDYNLHNVVIAPHCKQRGKFDGAIFKDGTIVKVSAHAPAWVSFKVWRNRKGKVEYSITDKASRVIDKIANIKKHYENAFNHGNFDYSKVYINQNLPGAELESWWEDAEEDCGNFEKWENTFEEEKQKQLREKLAKTL